MTSRLLARLAAESAVLDRRAELRRQLEESALPPLVFVVAWLGSGRPGDSGGASGEYQVLLDGEAASVDPARVQIAASINAETGVAAMEKFTWRAWTPEIRAAYLEWMRGWYG